MKLLQLTSTLLITLLLTACGGSSSNSGNSNPVNADNIYSGSFTENGETFEISGIVYNNKIFFVNIDSGLVYYGTTSISGNILTSNIDGYDDIDGKFVDAQITLTINEGVGATGSFSSVYTENNANSQGTISLSVVDHLPSNHTLNTIAGTFSTTTDGVTDTVIITSSGDLSGSDSEGCSYSGSVSVISLINGFYDLSTLTVSNCLDNNGNYSGILISDGTNLLILFANDNAAYGGELTRVP